MKKSKKKSPWPTKTQGLKYINICSKYITKELKNEKN